MLAQLFGPWRTVFVSILLICVQFSASLRASKSSKTSQYGQPPGTCRQHRKQPQLRLLVQQLGQCNSEDHWQLGAPGRRQHRRQQHPALRHHWAGCVLPWHRCLARVHLLSPTEVEARLGSLGWFSRTRAGGDVEFS